MNHCVQHFENAAAYEATRVSYCRHECEKWQMVEDAITGNRLRIKDQLLKIKTEDIDKETKKLSPAAIAAMDQNDLQWVRRPEREWKPHGKWSKDNVFMKGTLVRALGHQGTVDTVSQKDYEAMRLPVVFDEGSSHYVHADNLLVAQPVSGVKNEEFQGAETMFELMPLLTKPQQNRAQGANYSQPVLIRAGPGTGKTWSMSQLVYLLAESLGAAVGGAKAAVAAQRKAYTYTYTYTYT